MHATPHRSLIHRRVIALIAMFFFASSIHADKPIPDTPASKPGAIDRMDYGRAMAYTIKAKHPKNNIAYKGLAVGLGEKKNGQYQAAVIYDLDTMRVMAGSVGGHLDISKINYTSYKGKDVAHVAGEQLFGSKPGPGWANPKTGKWDDPRAYKNGPLPKQWLRYHGHYEAIHGDYPVLSYALGPFNILEWPRQLAPDVLERTLILNTQTVNAPFMLRMLVCEEPRAKARLINKNLAVLDSGEHMTAVYSTAGSGVFKIAGDDRIEFEYDVKLIEPGKRSFISESFYSWHGKKKTDEQLNRMFEFKLALQPIPRGRNTTEKQIYFNVLNDVYARCSPDVVTLTGARGRPTDKSAYVIDTIPVPLKNPHNSWMRLTGFDFFSDGNRAAVCTWNGDVWIVSGIDDNLKEVKWHRYASGLFEPLGVAIVDDEVYALGRDRLTKLHDKNKDGVADFYENFNADFPTYPRAITTELQVDSQGNFYFQKNGNRTPDSVPMHGSILRISKDGSKVRIFAHGIRSANGMGVGRVNGREVIASSDQEGNWTPASRIDFLLGNQYVGYKPHAHLRIDPPDDAYKRPVCWLPKDVDNSPGGLAYIADHRWGPYKGNWVATSYGQCRLFLLMHETLPWTQPKDYDPRNASKTITQGGVVTFPLNFGTGIHRVRFNPRDGQLYVLGLKGWQTKGALDGAFYRVRYTGRPALLPTKLEAVKHGVRLTFTNKLDRELAEDLDSFEVKRWNYIYSSKYGSPEMSIADPSRRGRDDVKVTKAELSRDGKTITLFIDDMKRAMQMMVKYDLETKDGDVMRNAVVHTVHALDGTD